MKRASAGNAVPGLTVHAATPSRWADVEKLFGERGACGGCWCMYWLLPKAAWGSGKGATNKRRFKKVIKDGGRPGVIGYVGREPVAWCAIAPREQYVRMRNSRVLKPVDDQPVWSITCFFIARPWRKQGFSVQLLRAAVDFARRRGARIVEGYPTVPTMKKTPDPFVYMGVPSTYERAGFKEVARRSKTRPIMRRIVGGS